MSSLPQSGGTTSSFSNAPQAKTDIYSYIEDVLLTNSSLYNTQTETLTLAVMDNDLGGRAKTLFSIDDGTGNPIVDLSTTDLLSNSTFSAWQATASGNLIRIYNGNIEFRIADGSGGFRDVDSLTAGETFTDSFTYAIRLGNGTLSWARVSINLTGSADAAAISGNSSGDVVEAGFTVTGIADSSGTLNVTDVDSGEALFAVPASLNGTYGNFTFNEVSGQWSYQLDNDRPATQALKNGQNVTDTLSVSSFDGSANQNIVVTISGTNDAPVARDDSGLSTEYQTALSIDPATLLANDDDVDSATLNITSVSGAVGGTVEIISGQIVFTPAAGFSGDASFTYEITDDAGGTSTATAFLVIEPADCIIGTSGDDNLIGTAADDCIDGALGNDRLVALGGNDELRGGEGNDILLAGAGNDQLYGGEGSDNLIGGGGNDQLYGEGGNDVMTGSENDDIIVGGLGADQMIGGFGNDIFRFDSISEFGLGDIGRDVINNFEKGLDTIDIRALGLTAANLNFVSVNNNTGTLIEIDYDLDSIVDGELQINGAQIGIGDFVI